MRKWVLWGHHLTEYVDMFDLGADIVDKKVLEFASGPTAVNKELTAKSGRIQSCDPWFSADFKKMQHQFSVHLDQQLERMQTFPERFNFDKYGGCETFIAKRQQGISEFLNDYLKGYAQGRYLGVEDFHLPFPNSSFDIALCSNYLFADLPSQDLEFHLKWIKELARVAHEVCIYPLTENDGQISQWLGPVLLQLQQEGFLVAIQEVPFRLLPNSKAMLKLSSDRCNL